MFWFIPVNHIMYKLGLMDHILYQNCSSSTRQIIFVNLSIFLTHPSDFIESEEAELSSVDLSKFSNGKKKKKKSPVFLLYQAAEKKLYFLISFFSLLTYLTPCHFSCYNQSRNQYNI